MSKISKLFSLPCLTAGLLVVLVFSLAPSALQARDQVEFGRYLGVRLQMWEESYAVLDKIIAEGTPEQKSRALSNKAQVMKAEADFEFNKDQDEEARNKRYAAAVEIFGDPEDSDGIVSKGIMEIDLAMALRRSDPDQARKYCDDAIKMFDTKRRALDKNRFNAAGKTTPEFKKQYANYSKMFFNYCRAYYVKGMTYETGSPDREAQFKLCEKWIGEFLFSLDDPTEEAILTYPLQGDIAIARGRPEDAVSHFTDCVKRLAGESATYYVATLALENGYLRAAELLTSELDFDPDRLKQCVELYTEAYTRYGAIAGLESYFKRFQLYRISALIKLGDESQIQDAINLLFKLAADKDANFRRQALQVLADIATRNNLDTELRFKCAGTVYAGLETNTVPVILKNIQAYQSLLEVCSDVKTFETYAPACFTRIGKMYWSMWRFLDAALVYREACYRTAYFQDKFAAESPVPEHMRGRCSLITDGKSLHGFPGEMANQFSRNASFLVDKTYGEPNNRYFQRLKVAADQMKADLAGRAAKMDLGYDSAKKLYDEHKYAQAAVRMVNLPADYRSYKLALYIGAKSYFNVSLDPSAPRDNHRGERDDENFRWDIENKDWYEKQIARHKTDLDKLPAALIDGVAKPHWDAILDPSTPAELVNWNKAVYYYKKYFLFEAQKAWDDIKDSMAEIKNPTIADAIGAIAQFHNAAWLRDNPGGKGEPDPDMKRMAYAAYDLAYLLRYPPKDLSPEVRNKLLAQERGLALAILRPYWKWFGIHLAGNKNYQKGALRLAFFALSEAKDGDACEQVYLAYVQAFPDDGKEISIMCSNVYTLLRDQLTPKTNALARASSVLISRSNQLKKNAFARINGSVNADWAGDLKKFQEAKTSHEKRMILAKHFWDRWMCELLFDGEKNADIQKYLPNLKATVQSKWDQMTEEYPKRWANAVRSEYDKELKKDTYAPVKAELKKAMSGASDYDILDKVKALQDAEMAKKDSDGKKVQLYADLTSFINLGTKSLTYFTGTIFIYDFGDFLEEQAREIDERARPDTTRILKYYEEYRVRTNRGGPGGLSEDAVKLLGTQYFRIRDWQNAVKYLNNYVERFGGDRAWGKEEEVPVDQRNKRIGKTSSGNELEVKYDLGKAYLELYKEDKDIEKLKKAALLMRRCWCFNLVRDANVLGGERYKYVTSTGAADTQLKKAVEDNYLNVGRAMAEIFLLLHDAGDVKIQWPKYVNQFTKTLTPKKDKNGKIEYQEVPAGQAGYLWQANQIHLRIWTSFKKLDEYQFRDEFRDNLVDWLELNVQWIKTFGTKDMGVEELKNKGVQTKAQEAFDAATNESALDATYLPDKIKDYLKRLKDDVGQLKKACADAKIKLKTE